MASSRITSRSKKVGGVRRENRGRGTEIDNGKPLSEMGTAGERTTLQAFNAYKSKTEKGEKDYRNRVMRI